MQNGGAHLCVTHNIGEDQRSQRDGNSAIRINMQSAIPGMCAHVGGLKYDLYGKCPELRVVYVVEI